MPGYLRPHIQTIFPGPKDPKHSHRQAPAGRPGTYWIEFSFQPNPLLKSDFGEKDLRSGFIGDSHFVISEPLHEGTVKKHIFTVRDTKNKGEHFIYCNSRGRLSHVNFSTHADSFDQAIELAKRNFEPFLSGWSTRYNTPLYVFRVRVLEESSNIVRNILFHQLYPEVHITLKDMNREYWFPGDLRVLNFYREAINATSPQYQFLCFFKVIELVLTLRAKRDALSRKQGKKIRRLRDFLLKEGWFMQHLSDDLKPIVIGKKFTAIRDDVLRPIRNRIAHALVEDDDSSSLLSDEEVFPYLPIAKLMAERLIVAESQEQQTGAFNGNQ